MLGSSGQYMVIIIPQGQGVLPSIEDVKRLYGKPDRVDATGKDDSYFYGKIILQTEKGSKNIVGIGAPFNWFLEGLKKKAAQ